MKDSDFFPAGERSSRRRESLLSSSQNTLTETSFVRDAELLIVSMTTAMWLQNLSKDLDNIMSHGIGIVLHCSYVSSLTPFSIEFFLMASGDQPQGVILCSRPSSRPWTTL